MALGYRGTRKKEMQRGLGDYRASNARLIRLMRGSLAARRDVKQLEKEALDWKARGDAGERDRGPPLAGARVRYS